MKIIIFGARGRLGSFLTFFLKEKYDVRPFSKEEVNILDRKALRLIFEEISPDLIINCAGYTDVNAAEKNPQDAYDINVKGVQNICGLCKKLDIPLVHFSTDYVYGGKSSLPYTENDLPFPLNTYGRTKWEGECVIKEQLKKYVIFRSCWLYSTQGRSFLNLVIDAHKQHRFLTIVDDQIGCPTPIPLLGEAVRRWIENFSHKGSYGTYHVSSRGACNWFEFASEIKRQLNLTVEILPISTEEFNIKNPGQAVRPKFSALNSEKFSKEFFYEIPSWESALRDYLKSI